jgi:hypothetical protein
LRVEEGGDVADFAGKIELKFITDEGKCFAFDVEKVTY